MTMITMLAEVKGNIEGNESFMDAMGFLARVKGAKVSRIKTEAMHGDYAECLLQIKKVVKELEEARKAVAGPYQEAKRYIDSAFAEIRRPLEQKADEYEKAIKFWRVHLRELEKKAQEKAEAARSRIQEQMAKSGVDAPPPEILTPRMSNIKKTAEGSVHGRTTTKYEVVYKGALVKAVAERQVPDTVLDVNMVNVRRLIQAGMQVPGIRVYEEEIISTRT